MWLKLAPLFFNVVFTGTILTGAEMVLVSAGLLPVSEISVLVFPIPLAPVILISSGCATEDAFTSFR